MYQGTENDRLLRQITRIKKVDRMHHPDTESQIHHGTIWSGNAVIKEGEEGPAETRIGRVLCGMEVASLMDEISYLVIRGICTSG